MNEKIFQVNLEEVISKYAWKAYLFNKNFAQKWFMKRSNYEFDIRWGYLDFKHETIPEKKENATKAKGDTNDKAEEDKPTDGATGDEKTAEKSVVQTAIEQLTPAVHEAKKKGVELYFSEYENRTLTTQTYKFTTTRQTTETTRIEMQENYTLGAQTNLSVNLGEIVSFGGQLSASLSVTETKAQEYSKSLTWNIDTDIKVPRWNRAKATLYVYETPTTSSFEVKTTMRLPSGKLPVSIRQVKDGKEVYVVWIQDLGALFDEDYKRKSGVRIEEETVERDGRMKIVNVVVLTTRGICRYVGFKNQHVEVECKEMAGAPPNLPPLSEDNH
ncbi:hypothetical protein ACF0H5_017894 [Mactra antiquata]